MSIVELRVELPAYSRSFLVAVPTAYTVAELKREITRTCPGAPRADGQRIIWRGRILADEERVEDVWKVRCVRPCGAMVLGTDDAHCDVPDRP